MTSDDESKRDPIQFALKRGITIDFLSSFRFKHTGPQVSRKKILGRKDDKHRLHELYAHNFWDTVRELMV